MIMRTRLIIMFVFSLTACTLNVGGEEFTSPDLFSKNSTVLTPTSSISQSASAQSAMISFIINVHDWVNIDESAATLLRLVDLFEKYQVRGDFYFTAPEVEALMRSHPQVVERLKNSAMTISYHVRPPHPLCDGFDSRFKGLKDDELYQMLVDYETYQLDLATGDLVRSRPGGYRYVAQVFGRKPVTASAPSSDRRIRMMMEKIYAQMGARVAVHYHEEGTAVDQPFEFSNGLFIRPSDFSITRIPDGRNFWWNFMSSPKAAEFDPLKMLQTRLAAWQEGRPPFITVLIHENNFYRSGPESWTAFYYDHENKDRPLSPPYDLTVRGQSKSRAPADQDAIWQAYERLVAFTSGQLKVITSSDLILLPYGGSK
jgi:peptidoglycan/xylan/chitin deacetylase (PgdA/CDA1 family)